MQLKKVIIVSFMRPESVGVKTTPFQCGAFNSPRCDFFPVGSKEISVAGINQRKKMREKKKWKLPCHCIG